MISASQVLNATETCFLEPQDTAARPSWKTKPLKLIRSPILNPRIRIFLPLGWRLWRGGSSSLVVLLLSLSTRYARISSYLSYGGLVRTTTCLGACSWESVSNSLWLSSGNARPVWRGSPLTSFDSCKVGSFDHVRGWRRRMVDVAGDGTWSHVVRDIKDIVARALASLHRGGRPFAQSPDH